MVRSEIVQAIAHKNPHLSPDEAERIVTTIFEAVVDHLTSGGRVELRGFGVFSSRARRARTGRNPRTGDKVEVAAKRAVHFAASKVLLARLSK